MCIASSVCRMCIASSGGILELEIYRHGSSDAKFHTAPFQKKNVICKHDSSFLNHESISHHPKIFKMLNKRKEW